MRLFNSPRVERYPISKCPNIWLLNHEESLPDDFQIQITKHIIRNKNKYLPDNLHIQITSFHFSHLRQDLHWTNKPSFTFVCRVDASFKKSMSTTPPSHDHNHHRNHLLGVLVQGAVEENSNMFMLVHQLDKSLPRHICESVKVRRCC